MPLCLWLHQEGHAAERPPVTLSAEGLPPAPFLRTLPRSTARGALPDVIDSEHSSC